MQMKVFAILFDDFGRSDDSHATSKSKKHIYTTGMPFVILIFHQILKSKTNAFKKLKAKTF